VVQNSSYLFSATGLVAGLSFLQNILVGRMLGIAGVGVLGTIIMFTSVINKFASFRMSELVIKYVGQYSEEGDTPRCAAVFKAAALAEMLASTFAFGLICLLAPLGAKLFVEDAAYTNWFILYGLIVLANLVAESSTGLLQIFDRYRRMAVLNVVQGVFTLVVIALAYWFGGGMPGVLLAYLGGKVIGALSLTVAAFRESGRRWGQLWWRTPLTLLRSQARELVRFAISTNISATLSLINKDSELLWISLFRPNEEVGYYRTALSIVNLIQLPIAPLPQATYPELSRQVARRDWAGLRRLLRSGSLLAGGFTLAAGLFLVAFGQVLIPWMYDDRAFLPAYPAVLILLVGFLVANTFYWNRTALLALGRPGFPARVNLVLALFKILGIILLVPRYGYLANAGLLAGSYLLGVSLCAYMAYHLISSESTQQAATRAGA
jgi:O-antigen/teichoic acid export membrane protein